MDSMLQTIINAENDGKWLQSNIERIRGENEGRFRQVSPVVAREKPEGWEFNSPPRDSGDNDDG